MLIWTFSLLQWNCMVRSKNIGELAYQNFTSGDDYIKIRYDKTKNDQDDEKIKDKHIYANPFNPIVCPFLALGSSREVIEEDWYDWEASVYGDASLQDDAIELLKKMRACFEFQKDVDQVFLERGGSSGTQGIISGPAASGRPPTSPTGGI